MKTLAQLNTWLASPEGKSHRRRQDVELERNLIQYNQSQMHAAHDDDSIRMWLLSKPASELAQMVDCIEKFAEEYKLPMPEPAPVREENGVKVIVKKIDDRFVAALKVYLTSPENNPTSRFNMWLDMCPNCEHNRRLERQIELCFEHINTVLLCQ